MESESIFSFLSASTRCCAALVSRASRRAWRSSRLVIRSISSSVRPATVPPSASSARSSSSSVINSKSLVLPKSASAGAFDSSLGERYLSEACIIR
ncbi:F-box protein [Escherichia coli]|uniref:F-box protein n=1 Tax=Escherichia coli TaxID=562 RepID=UPI00359CB09C